LQAFVLAFLTWLLIAAPFLQAGDLDPGYWDSSPLPQMGVATYYAPGVMEWVRNYRRAQREITDCPDCVGAVALLRAGDIGRKVWLQPPGGELAGPFIVVDCARDTDIPALLDRNWAVDVGYDLGQLWGMAGPLDGVIVWADPGEPATGPARPAGRPLPAYIDPSQVVISPPTATPAPFDQSPTRVAALPTRLPMPLAQVTPKPVLPKPAAGTPTVTVPTPTPVRDGATAPAMQLTGVAGAARTFTATPGGQASPAAPAQLPILAVLATASAAQRATARAPAAKAPSEGTPNGGSPNGGSSDNGTPGPSSVAIGRPGAGLLARPVVLRMPTPTVTPTRDPARPTSLPILPPEDTPAPGLSAPQPLSPLDSFWQTLLDLLGH
jgi:hypothetical protein